MSDLQLPDRLTQLRSRWEADPASRIFLQLAEEYRHLGRLHEALAVLEAGLKEHPGYLSALVAKGRCLLDLGNPEPAREVLERVVRQDATQAVANKLLVRAYIETGQGDRARERLDLYGLLHDGDPEIAELRGRIRRLESGGPPTPTPPPPTPQPEPLPRAAAPSPPAPARPRTEEDVFQLDYPPAPRVAAQAAVADVFELDYPSPATATATLAPPEPAPAAPPAAAEAAAVEVDELEPTAEGEPFPGLVSRGVRQRYLSGLAAEGLFPLSLDLAPATSTEPVHAPGEIFPLRSIGEAVEAELKRSALEAEPEPAPLPAPAPFLAPEPEPLAPEPPPELAEDIFALGELPPMPPMPPIPEPPAAAAPEVATVTLGELYLKQGHVGEAEQIFAEVLRREPDNTAAKAAREALSHLAQGREEPEPVAAPAAASAAFTVPAGPGDRQQRKIRLLNSYLERIRRGSHPDVP